MKKDKGYDMQPNASMTRFLFTSTGAKGNIEKVVEFTFLQKKRWNLAFGDVEDKDWTDNVISDNNDMRVVLQTVANTVHLFFEKYPDREVYIEPLGEQRKLLYNRIFQQKWAEISPFFSVKGTVGDADFEDYNPQKRFDYFLIELKSDFFK
jgi:hypothetical protein